MKILIFFALEQKLHHVKLYILKGYTNSYLDLNKNSEISPYLFRNGSCKFMQLTIFSQINLYARF